MIKEEILKKVKKREALKKEQIKREAEVNRCLYAGVCPECGQDINVIPGSFITTDFTTYKCDKCQFRKTIYK